MVNDSEARQSLQRIDSQAENTGRKIGAIGKIGQTMGKVIKVGTAAAISGMGLLTGIVGKTGLAYNAMAENSKVAWETLLGGKDEANKMFEDIQKFAKSTQFDSTSVDAMAKYMHNAGLEGKGLFDELTKVADVAGAFNIPAEGAQELTRQMSQVRQAGVAYTEDLNILQDRGVPIYKAISDQLGVTVGDVKKMASEGKISSDIYLQAFDSIAKGVEGSSKKQSETFTGMLSTLKDNLAIISGELTKGLFEKFKGTLDSVMPVIERFSTTLKDEGLKAALSEIFGADKVNTMYNVFNTIRDVGIIAFNGLKDAVKFVADNFNIFAPILTGVLASITAFKIISTITNLMNLWKASTIAQTIATKGLNGAMKANPIGVVITLIGLLVAAGVALYKNWDKVKAFAGQLWDKLKTVFGNIKDSAVERFNSVKNAIINPIESAKDKVKGIVDKIKGFFTGLKIKLPNIKLPHFSVSWSKKGFWGKVGDFLGMPGKPNIDVDWYATGTNYAKGGLAVVGERGAELVNLPRGSKVSTANETKKSLEGKQIINVTLNYQGNNVQDAYSMIDIIEDELNNRFSNRLIVNGVRG